MFLYVYTLLELHSLTSTCFPADVIVWQCADNHCYCSSQFHSLSSSFVVSVCDSALLQNSTNDGNCSIFVASIFKTSDDILSVHFFLCFYRTQTGRKCNREKRRNKKKMALYWYRFAGPNFIIIFCFICLAHASVHCFVIQWILFIIFTVLLVRFSFHYRITSEAIATHR